MIMLFTADELLHELDLVDATIAQLVRCAGTGASADFERRLDTHARSLRAMLDVDGAAVVQDTMEAARRVLDAADPAAPIMMLDMARENLAAVIRRQAARATPRAA